MADANFYRNANLESPGWKAVAVTPADGADLPQVAARVMAMVAGAMVVTASGGGTVTVAALAGVPLPFFVDRVWATGTLATGIVAIYGQ